MALGNLIFMALGNLMLMARGAVERVGGSGALMTLKRYKVPQAPMAVGVILVLGMALVVLIPMTPHVVGVVGSGGAVLIIVVLIILMAPMLFLAQIALGGLVLMACRVLGGARGFRALASRDIHKFRLEPAVFDGIMALGEGLGWLMLMAPGVVGAELVGMSVAVTTPKVLDGILAPSKGPGGLMRMSPWVVGVELVGMLISPGVVGGKLVGMLMAVAIPKVLLALMILGTLLDVEVVGAIEDSDALMSLRKHGISLTLMVFGVIMALRTTLAALVALVSLGAREVVGMGLPVLVSLKVIPAALMAPDKVLATLVVLDEGSSALIALEVVGSSGYFIVLDVEVDPLAAGMCIHRQGACSERSGTAADRVAGIRFGHVAATGWVSGREVDHDSSREYKERVDHSDLIV